MKTKRDNSGKFCNGHEPWNKGDQKFIDINYCTKEYKKGYSCVDLGNKFNVSEKTIRNRFKAIGFELRNYREQTEMRKQKISNTLKERGIEPKERFSGDVWNKGLTKDNPKVKANMKNLLEARKYQVMPLKDTKIEVKIQNFLKKLEIEFYTHQYINIEHGYQCDILIPKQDGIYKKTIIECFGVYWHNYPRGREVDNKRCTELRDKGWRVLVFWENEVKPMMINNLRNKVYAK